MQSLKSACPPCHAQCAASLLSLAYKYGTTNNNGNVQSVTYNGGGLSCTQTVGYDALNRLTTSVENGAYHFYVEASQ